MKDTEHWIKERIFDHNPHLRYERVRPDCREIGDDNNVGVAILSAEDALRIKTKPIDEFPIDGRPLKEFVRGFLATWEPARSRCTDANAVVCLAILQ